MIHWHYEKGEKIRFVMNRSTCFLEYGIKETKAVDLEKFTFLINEDSGNKEGKYFLCFDDEEIQVTEKSYRKIEQSFNKEMNRRESECHA